MNSEQVKGALELIRPVNVAIIMAVIGAAVLLADGPATSAVLAALAGGLIGGAANAINDYFDVEIDRVNRPDRPLPRGAVTPRVAVIVWLTLSAVGISLNLFLHSPAPEIAGAAVAGLFAYSAIFKRTMLLGNLLVAGMTALAFIYGAIVAGNPEQALFPALFAFLLNLGREILKDIEDMRGDRAGNAGTLPIKKGVPAALGLATGSFVLLIGSTLVPFLSGAAGTLYLTLVGVVDAVLIVVLVSAWMDHGPANLARMNTVLKAEMILGLIALYIGL